MKASSLSLQAAVLLALVGMGWGAFMGASGDHATHGAHAHLNLLGFVSLFLFGLFYHLHPATDRAPLAAIHVWVWIGGTVLLTIGVAMITTGRDAGEPVAAVASLILIADMLLFAWLVARRNRSEARATLRPGE